MTRVKSGDLKSVGNYLIALEGYGFFEIRKSRERETILKPNTIRNIGK